MIPRDQQKQAHRVLAKLPTAETVETLSNSKHRGFPKNRGAKYRFQNSMTDIIRIPTKRTPNVWKQPYGDTLTATRLKPSVLYLPVLGLSQRVVIEPSGQCSCLSNVVLLNALLRNPPAIFKKPCRETSPTHKFARSCADGACPTSRMKPGDLSLPSTCTSKVPNIIAFIPEQDTWASILGTLEVQVTGLWKPALQSSTAWCRCGLVRGQLQTRRAETGRGNCMEASY